MTSPFEWRGKPSIFANDRHFKANSKGLSINQVAQRTVDKVYATGKNHGTLLGVSENPRHWSHQEFLLRRSK